MTATRTICWRAYVHDGTDNCQVRTGTWEGTKKAVAAYLEAIEAEFMRRWDTEGFTVTREVRPANSRIGERTVLRAQYHYEPGYDGEDYLSREMFYLMAPVKEER